MLQLTLFDTNTVLQPGQQVDTYASVGDQPEVPGVPVGTIVSVHSSSGSLTQTAVVRPFVNFTALGVVGIVVQVPRHNPRTTILPRPAPTVTVTVTPTPSSSASFTPGTGSATPPTGGTSSPTATPSATGGGG
jgi:rod shape-determining protein MreC